MEDDNVAREQPWVIRGDRLFTNVRAPPGLEEPPPGLVRQA